MIDSDIVTQCRDLIKSARIFERSFSQPVCVLDTNVALDLWLFDDAGTRHIKTLIENEALVAVGHFDTFVELADVISRDVFQLTESDRKHVLQNWLNHTHIFTADLAQDSFCRDPDDDKFFALAKATGARYLISKDKKVLKARSKAKVFGCTVFTPSKFCALKP